ncbi:MAG: hypothetical protein V1928_01800 [Parcubacteria group bacterium]
MVGKNLIERKRMAVFNPATDDSPEETLIALAKREDRENALEAVKAQLQMMCPSVRQVLVMNFGLEDGQYHDYAEIAEATGYKEKVIPLIIDRAIHQLRQAVV